MHIQPPEIVTHSIRAPEVAKYEEVWSHPSYNVASPGQRSAEWFLSIVKAQPPMSILDIGGGAGWASKVFLDAGYHVEILDHVRPEQTIVDVPFHLACLWDDWQSDLFTHPDHFDLGYCADVMEHIPTEFTMLVIARCLTASQRTFFRIANTDEAHGPMLIGESLHPTIRPFVWWRDRIAEVGRITDARDCVGYSTFVVEEVK